MQVPAWYTCAACSLPTEYVGKPHFVLRQLWQRLQAATQWVDGRCHSLSGSRNGTKGTKVASDAPHRPSVLPHGSPAGTQAAQWSFETCPGHNAVPPSAKSCDGAQATGKHPMHRALRTTLWAVPMPACWRLLGIQRHGQRRASMSRGAATAAVAGARMRLHTCCHQGCPLPRPADCDAGAAAGRGGQRVHEERSTCAGWGSTPKRLAGFNRHFVTVLEIFAALQPAMIAVTDTQCQHRQALIEALQGTVRR